MKKLLSLMLLFTGFATGAWALEQDDDGYYLIGSAQDWRDFAALVQTTPTANARMTADIDLGTTVSMIGSNSSNYQGIFDGQGHSLSFTWQKTWENLAPFEYIHGATIKNLASVGELTYSGGGTGLVLYVNGEGNVIEKCYVKVPNPVTSGLYQWQADLLLMNSGSEVLIKDCLCQDISKQTVIYDRGANSVISIENSLFITPGLSSIALQRDLNATTTNSYCVTTSDDKSGNANCTQVTTEQLASGEITEKLQAERSEEVWVQDAFINQPMLKIFANKMSYTVPTSGVGTFSTGVAVTLPDGLEAYYCKNYDGTKGTVSTQKIEGTIPANTGVLLRGTGGETYTISASAETPEAIDGNALVAVTEATHVEQTEDDNTNFMLTGGKFVKIGGSATSKMPANRAYLQIATASLPSGNSGESLVLEWADDTPTAVDFAEGTATAVADGAYYTLDGQRLAGKPVKKGIYVSGGKKVIR